MFDQFLIYKGFSVNTVVCLALFSIVVDDNKLEPMWHMNGSTCRSTHTTQIDSIHENRFNEIFRLFIAQQIAVENFPFDSNVRNSACRMAEKSIQRNICYGIRYRGAITLWAAHQFLNVNQS